MAISIIDYGMGNLRSVQKAFEKCGFDARIISSPRDVLSARSLVLPGVGAFKKCFQNLDSLGLIEPILSSIKAGKPFLGICLGLQILFSESEEFGRSEGLDVIKGKVIRFTSEQLKEASQQLKIPHMGWNSITSKKANPYLQGIDDGSFLYFVHSYHVVPEDQSAIATTTLYGSTFVSSILQDNIFACQFHPEKSQATGLRILTNFGRIAEKEP